MFNFLAKLSDYLEDGIGEKESEEVGWRGPRPVLLEYEDRECDKMYDGARVSAIASKLVSEEGAESFSKAVKALERADLVESDYVESEEYKRAAGFQPALTSDLDDLQEFVADTEVEVWCYSDLRSKWQRELEDLHEKWVKDSSK